MLCGFFSPWGIVVFFFLLLFLRRCLAICFLLDQPYLNELFLVAGIAFGGVSFFGILRAAFWDHQSFNFPSLVIHLRPFEDYSLFCFFSVARRVLREISSVMEAELHRDSSRKFAVRCRDFSRYAVCCHGTCLPAFELCSVFLEFVMWPISYFLLVGSAIFGE